MQGVLTANSLLVRSVSRCKLMSHDCLFFNVCGRVSPSDADSTASEQSSGRETGEETARPSAVANEGKPRRATKKGVLLGFLYLKKQYKACVHQQCFTWLG